MIAVTSHGSSLLFLPNNRNLSKTTRRNFSNVGPTFVRDSVKSVLHISFLFFFITEENINENIAPKRTTRLKFVNSRFSTRSSTHVPFLFPLTFFSSLIFLFFFRSDQLFAPNQFIFVSKKEKRFNEEKYILIFLTKNIYIFMVQKWSLVRGGKMVQNGRVPSKTKEIDFSFFLSSFLL